MTWLRPGGSARRNTVYFVREAAALGGGLSRLDGAVEDAARALDQQELRLFASGDREEHLDALLDGGDVLEGVRVAGGALVVALGEQGLGRAARGAAVAA